MAVTYLHSSQITALQTKLGGSTIRSLADLRAAFFGNASNSTGIRNYLTSQLGLTTGIYSTNDLWRRFFIFRGITNQVSLGDMAKQFFTGPGFP